MRLPGLLAHGPEVESRRLRALILIDTESRLAGLDQDQEHMEAMVREFKKRGVADVTVLREKKVTKDKVLEFFRAESDASTDTVLFYYSGHGATDPRLGHFIAYQRATTFPLDCARGNGAIARD